MLAQSERKGCALGAALAVAADWVAIRGVLDAAAVRFGVEVPPCYLGGGEDVRGLADRLAGSPGFDRALLFGADQIVVQHHGLWSLLEARQQARGTD
jgi:hypothetical protein